MTENHNDPALDGIPEAVTSKKRRLSIQLVWLVPLVALLVGLTLAVRAWREHGRTVTISFTSGEGLVAGKTKIKYKEVEVGEVKNISIARERSHVVVTAQIDREAKDFLVEDTRFWVVRARITGGNVSGLGTLMGGSYIGLDAGRSKKSQRSFIGLETPPVVAMDVPGTKFVLRSADIGSLSTGSPLFFRRVQVGQVVGFEMDREGKGLNLTVFVSAPYDRYVRRNSLFWHASGIDVSVSGTGVNITTESIASILLGGISFQSPDDGTGSPRAGQSDPFTLYSTKEEALRHAATAQAYVMVFTEPVKGLSAGATVEFQGVNVGEVAALHLELDPRRKTVAIPVEIRLYPGRFSREETTKPGDGRAFMDDLVRRGLQGELQTGNLLTGQRHISLSFAPFRRKKPVSLRGNLSEIPVAKGSGDDLQATLLRLAKKVEKMPLGELVNEVRQGVRSLDRSLRSVDQLVKRLDAEIVPEMRETLKAAHTTLGDAGELLKTDAPLQEDLRETLRELTRTVRAVRVLADYLEMHPETLIRGKKGEEQ